MKIGNRLGLPPAFERALHAHQHDRGGAEITVSELIGPPRIRMLRKRYPEQISADVSDMLWLLFGTAVHEHLAKHATNALTEERLGMDVTTALGTWRVSGAFDSLSLDHDGSLDDYKTTSIWRVIRGDYSAWEEQVNLYAHLAEHHGLEVRTLRAIVLCRDWHHGDKKRHRNYPALPITVVTLPLWDDETRQRFLMDRVLLHQEAERNLPLCSDEDRWKRRDGTFARCENYCDALVPCRDLVKDAQWS